MIEIEQNHYGQHIHKSDEHHLQESEEGLYGLAIVSRWRLPLVNYRC